MIRKSALINAAVALASLVVALFLAEAVLWLVFRAPLPPPPSRTVLLEHDTLLGWRKIPNAEGAYVAEEWSAYESVNAKGLRGPEYPYRKPEGTYRVLLLGDSFTEGHTQNLDETISDLVAGALDSSGGPKFEIINGGTRGYSTDQEVLFYESEGVKYEPDLVVLMFYYNDVWYNIQSSAYGRAKPLLTMADSGLHLDNVPLPTPPEGAGAAGDAAPTPADSLLGPAAPRLRGLKAWLGSRSRLYNLVKSAVKNSRSLHSLAIRLGLVEATDELADGALPVPDELGVWKRSYTADTRAAWSTTEALINRLHGATTKEGAELLVFYIPERPSVYPDDWELTRRKYGFAADEWSYARDDEELARICETAGIDCIFPGDRFRSEAQQLARARLRLYYRSDAHWNARGHKLAADILAEYIKAQTLPTRVGSAPSARSNLVLHYVIL